MTQNEKKRTKRRMTADDFDAVKPLLKISEERVAAARASLVDGRTLQSIATDYGWVRQSVNDAVDTVWRTFERYSESLRTTSNAVALLPPGWEQVTLIAPSRLIEKFKAEIAEYASERELHQVDRSKC